MSGRSEDALNDLYSLSPKRPRNNNVQVDMVLYMQRRSHKNAAPGDLPLVQKMVNES
jgi:hypothetical protein